MGNSDSRAELRGVVEVLCDGTPGVEDGAGARKHVDHLPTGSAKHAPCN